jgi:cell division protein ZapE
VQLIDVLYEQRRLVVISAAVPVWKLISPYNAAAPQFERTVSRLTEMQSDDYVAGLLRD